MVQLALLFLSSVTVQLPTPSTVAPSATVPMTVAEHLMLFPPSPVLITVGAKLQMTLKTLKGARPYVEQKLIFKSISSTNI